MIARVVGEHEVEREHRRAENHEAAVIGERKRDPAPHGNEPAEHDQAAEQEAPHRRYFRRDDAELKPQRQPADAPQQHDRYIKCVVGAGERAIRLMFHMGLVSQQFERRID
jgi:hypothetical protein